ncbi:hypothetical protein EVS84_10115 [Pseudomonas koreensis]|uniref:Uncharacterized protein n=2 Tax=Pseudomonas TaxID=286 RepID=A0A4Q4L679_9PSED|nr:MULTISPECIES: hypothetical protein [Pseudomonas]MDM8193504.1 hypothetical protein [Pseudomonas fluorescens]MDP8574749.1 hypothetical protein [Pseudomonas iranensis]RYM42785.1 hypothetical protein EVS84_10115 [Pseudomonas koreensis]
MNVGQSVSKAIDEWEAGDLDSAMMHACNAVDNTAKRTYPNMFSSNARFTRLLRDNYSILGPMGLVVPGWDLVNYRFNIKLDNPKAPGGVPDTADVIYGIHRCCHSHGEALPEGFELFADARGESTHFFHDIPGGKVRLSDRAIFALLAVVVYAPVNKACQAKDGYYLTYYNNKMIINESWGRMSELKSLIESQPPGEMIVEEYE